MEETAQNETRNLRRKFQLWWQKSNLLSGGSIASVSHRLAIRYITILQWLPKYCKEDGICDLIAGISLGLMMLPQSIAYALLAGLSPEYGLYSSFVGVLVYVFLGKVKQVSIGLTSLMALLTLDYAQELSIDFVILLTFLSGCVEVLFGILQLGTLVHFISEPVVSGFTTAASVITAGAQMKGLLGIRYKSFGFLDNLWKFFHNLQDTKFSDTILGCSSIIFLIIFRNLKDLPIGQNKNVSLISDNKKELGNQRNYCKPANHLLKKSLWFLSIGRNAMIVLIGGILGYLFENKWGKATFALSAIGENTHATQEMITLGLSNIIASFVSSMPMCASFSRSAVSNASGIRTPLAGLYTGALIVLAIGFLTPYFYYIPRSTLAAVLISAVVFMADFKIFSVLWQTSRRDFFAAIVTFIGCLGIGMEVGLLLGVAVNCSFLLYFWARPTIHVENKKVDSNHEYLQVTPDAGFYFPSVEFVRIHFGKIGVHEGGGVLPVVLNCMHVKGLDYSAAKGIGLILKEFKTRKQPIAFLKLKKESLSLLKELGVNNFIHCNTEEELKAALYGGYLNVDGNASVVTENGITPEEVSQPLLGNHLISQETDEGSQISFTVNRNNQ